MTGWKLPFWELGMGNGEWGMEKFSFCHFDVIFPFYGETIKLKERLI